MPKKIDIIVGSNSYSSVAYFSKAIAQAFERKGWQTRIFYVGKDRFFEAFYAITQDPPDLTFSFSNVNFGKNSVCSVFGVPHFSYLLDPGIYYMHQLKGKYSFVSCVDRKDVNVMVTNKQPDEKSPIFLPHAIDVNAFNISKKKTLYDVVMMGTCHDYEKLRKSWSEQFSPEVRNFLDIAQEMVLSSKGISCYEALHALCGHLPEFKPHFVTLHRELDLYVTGKERVDLVRSLKGLKVEVFGKGPWKKYVPDANVHSQVSFSKALKIFNTSKIVLNSAPRFKDGSHERIFTSFAYHALPCCGLNPFFQEHYADGKNILFYNYGNYQGLQEKLEFYINQNQEREIMVDSGRKITKSCHTWDIRVETLWNYLCEFALND